MPDGSTDHADGQAKKPNIIVVMVDDLGYSDLGCYGGEISTPNIDSLAYGGLRFTQMYNGARCCPSRAALLTGLHPHQAGIGQMTTDLGVPAYQGYLRDDCVTIAEVLKGAGYRTLLSGKWHVSGGWDNRDRANWVLGDTGTRCRSSGASTGRSDSSTPPTPTGTRNR